MNRMSLKMKLIVAFLLIGLLPATAATLLAWVNGSRLINEEVASKMRTIRDLQEAQMHQEIDTIRAIAQVEGRNDTALSAVMDFSNAVKKLPEQLAKSVGEAKAREHAKAFLEGTWAKAWEKYHGAAPAMLGSLSSSYDATAAFLNYGYVGRVMEDSRGNQGLEGTDYGKAYETYHPYYAGLTKTMGYADVIVYDVVTERIVYSVAKELDLGLPILTGALSDTPLAGAVKKALASPGKTIMTDFERYFPSMNAPASYVATTMSRGGQPIAVMIFQVSFDSIDKIINLERKWEEHGLGKSGETFIIGQDRVLRTTLRSILTEKDKFMQSAKDRSMSADALKYMDSMGTTATAMKFDTELAKKAVAGNDEVVTDYDYKGNAVIAAIEPIFESNNKDLGLEWYLIVKYDMEEALAGIKFLKYLLMGLIGVTVVVVLFVSWTIGSTLSKNIARIADRIGEGSQAVADASHEIASGSTELSESVTEQASSLQETSAAVDEISAMVNKSAENAKETQTLARGSLAKVQEGKHAIGDMLNAMGQIRESNEKIVAQVTNNAKEFDSVVQIISEIGGRTKVINDIVFQTKLLSFNASVEAARAGEHGKGFAVVAEEVGNLAQMSGNAAKEISSMLEESIKRVNSIASMSKSSIEQLIEVGKRSVEDGNDKAQRCNTVFDDIMRDSSSVTGIVEEIATSSNEQATGIQEVTKAMGQLDQVTQQNSSVAQQSSVAAERLSSQSQNLNELVVELEVLVKGRPGVAKINESKMDVTHSKSVKVEAKKGDPNPKAVKHASVVPLRKGAPRPTSASQATPAVRQVANGGVVPDSSDPRFEEV